MEAMKVKAFLSIHQRFLIKLEKEFDVELGTHQGKVEDIFIRS